MKVQLQLEWTWAVPRGSHAPPVTTEQGNGSGKARRACVKHTPDLEDLVQITQDAERLNNFYVDYMLKIKCIRIDFNVATRK